MSRRVAILIDGGFFLKRLPKLVRPKHCATPGRIAVSLRHLCRRHIQQLTGNGGKNWIDSVYRILYYDAVPYDGKAHHPIDNRSIDFGRSELATSRRDLFDELRRQRKLALRLGKVNREHDWAIHPSLTKKLLRFGHVLKAFERLPDAPPTGAAPATTLALSAEEHREMLALRGVWSGMDSSVVRLGLRQKGVDMRIGIDIAAVALKRQADTIVLVSGDSDFVPAAKLARREGVDFILDPMWQQINDDLYEHIDGLQSGFPRPQPSRNPQADASDMAEAAHSPEPA